MIILESEWDEAAGVVEKSEQEEGEISATQSVATGSAALILLHNTP